MNNNSREELRKEALDLENNSKEDTGTMIDLYFDLFMTMSSKVEDKIFIKGNVLLNKLYPKEARTTLDLDISILDKDIFQDIIVPEFVIFGDNLVKSGVASRYGIHGMTERSNGGIRVFDKFGIALYSVDVSLTNMSAYGYIKYNFDGRYAYGSSIEKVLCDKCLATLSKRRFKRIKDFYDMQIILTSSIVVCTDIIYTLMVECVGIHKVNELLDNFPFKPNEIVNLINRWNEERLGDVNTGAGIPRLDFMDNTNKLYLLYRNLQLIHNKRCLQ